MHSSLADDLNLVLVLSAYFGLMNSAIIDKVITYLSLGPLENIMIVLELEDQNVGVSRQHRKPFGIDLFPSLGLEQSPQLVVLYINDQLSAVLVDEPGDGAHRFLGPPPDAHSIHVEVHFLGHTDDGNDRPEDQRVGVLEEHHPFDLLLLILPGLGQVVLVQQGVDVAMAVGLRLDQQLVLLQGEPGLVVQQRGHLLLLHYG